MKWNQERDDFLIANANKGIAGCTRAFNSEFGTHATESAITTRASRLNVSLLRYEICPECGAKVKRLAPSGMCIGCNARRNRDRAIERNKEIYRELMKNEKETEAERRKYEREYAAVRQDSHRKAKKIR